MHPGGGDEASSSARRRRRPEPSPTQRALSLLTRREHSRRELARKLGARGVEPALARATIDRLAEAGWQDDARFAQSLARARAAAGYGPAWIGAELRTHGLAEAVVADALASIDGAWQDVAAALLRRRFGSDGALPTETARKALDLLLRRGFPQGLARDVLRASAEDWDTTAD